MEYEFKQLLNTNGNWVPEIQRMRWAANKVVGEDTEVVSNPNAILSINYSLHLHGSKVYRLYGALLNSVLKATTSVAVDYQRRSWILPTVAAIQEEGPSPLFPLLDYVVQEMEKEGVYQLYGCIPKKYARAYDRRRKRESLIYSGYNSATVEELPPYCASYDHVFCTELTLGNVFTEPMLIRRYWRTPL